MTLESMFSLKGEEGADCRRKPAGSGLAIAQATSGAGRIRVLASRSLDVLEKEAAALRDVGYQAEVASTRYHGERFD